MDDRLAVTRAANELRISYRKAKQLYESFKREFPFDEPHSSLDLLEVAE